MTDRLGSVRANANGERMSYFPYGEERTSTADGREKFGTYFRDPAANGGLDYADQRYYANAGGRFLTPDPSTGSAAGDPGSWNKYAYVQGDPVNFADPSGLNRLLCDVYTDYGCAGAVTPTDPGVVTNWIYSEGSLAVGSSYFLPGSPIGGGDPIGGGGGPDPGPSKVTDLSGVLPALKQAINSLSANCQKVLPSQQTLLAEANDLKFFDARPTASGNQTVAQIAPDLAPYNPSGTLQSIAGGSTDATILNGPNGSISNTVLLGSQFFLDPVQGNNANYSVGQGIVLVHELLHYGTQLGDAQFVGKYNINLLVGDSNSSAINRWLQNDCKN